MLPGFRILLALVVLSFAILIFGFSALALLRTAHQSLASQPTWQPVWRTPIEIANAHRNDRQQHPSEMQTLALLRVERPLPQPAPEPASPAARPASAPANSTLAAEEQRDEATPGNTSPELKSLQPMETTAANRDDHPASTVPPDPVATAADKTSMQAAAPPPVDDAPKSTSANAGATGEAPQTAGPPGQAAASEPIIPGPDATAASPRSAEADYDSPTPEWPTKLAALPDTTTTSSESRPQPGAESATKPDPADLRARRRARARLHARRLALARARAARLAQTQQMTTNPTFYGSSFPIPQNAINPANATLNATLFGPPRGAP
jgi:hypothetical protein